MTRSCLIYLWLIFSLFLYFFVPSALAQETDTLLEGRVTAILEEKVITPTGGLENQLYQKLEIIITRGPQSGQVLIIESGDLPLASLPKYKVDDLLVISASQDDGGNTLYFISDYVRRDGLIILFIVFIIVALVIGKWHGFASLLGMGITYFVIFKFLLPEISAGKDPVIVSILAALLMVPITFYISHGLNKKTTIAIIGTIIALIVTGLLAGFFSELTRLTGFATEEAGFLQSFYPGTINIKGLLLAGIIIGGLGIFDDITVSQSAIVSEIKEASPKATFAELYTRAMNVGRDHIASLINTLVLVYTGAALPLLLLFVNNPKPFTEILNYEFIAEEIVRTLVASIGLILAVPLTTFIAALVFSQKSSSISIKKP